MIEKIARDVSNKLNATVSNDFEDMVGIEAHLEKMQSMLHLDDENGAMIVGICGPAGIGKTTIARALHSRLCSTFQLSCFMENLRGSRNRGLDEYGWKLRLQELLLSKILNQNGIKINHLGMIPERLCDQKVFIIIDDVDDLQQLEALANDTNWFGHGSRIIVTTEDQELLEQHGVDNIYHVDFPTIEEARTILCRYAFKGSLAPYGVQKLIKRATKLCSNLPLGLKVMGSMLRAKKEDDWESMLHRLEKSSISKIDASLRVGFDSLHENDQTLFLLIAVFFNYENDGHVKTMLADSGLDVRLGLKTLAYKSLIQFSTVGEIVMHKLLQQVGIHAIQRQDPLKRQILIDTNDIRYVLENDFDSGSLMGIRFDISTIKESIEISLKASKRMRNLQFLKIYNHSRLDTDVRMHLLEDMDFPPRLKLLHWEKYPGTCLPHSLKPEHFVELNLENSKLKRLWQGTQHLGNLKKLKLRSSYNLEELPDLAKATNLEILDVSGCWSLVEIHSSVGNLHKLETLEMGQCRDLQVVPSLCNLASLDLVSIVGCDQLRKLPDISATITSLSIADAMLREFTESIKLYSRLETLSIFGNLFMEERSGADMERIPDCIKDLPRLEYLNIVGWPDIERIPDCIKDFHRLENLWIIGCPKLASLPELPRSLTSLIVWNCESVETLVPFPFDSQIEKLYFPDYFELGPEARIEIIQKICWRRESLPGRDIPAEFNHRAVGNSLTISSNAWGFRMCVMLSPTSEMEGGIDMYRELMCRISINGCPTENCIFPIDFGVPYSEHLAIFNTGTTVSVDEQYSDILFEFSSSSKDIKIIECGVQILWDALDSLLKDRKNYDGSPSGESLENDSEELLEDTTTGSLLDESFELDESRAEIVEDLHASLELYDDASSQVETDDDLFAPTFFSFGF